MNRKRVLFISLVFAATFTMTSCHSLSTKSMETIGENSIAKWTDDLVRSNTKSARLKGGLAAMVFAEGGVVYAGGHGQSDFDSEISERTPMPIGSISKIFTAVAVMQLVEDGIIDLDKPAGVYLPQLQLADGAEMSFSVRDLLTHRSGLPGDIFLDWMVEKAGTAPMRRLYNTLNGTQLVATPGRLFSYSNIGFALLGLIIEESSGLAYEDYMRTRIFQPAGMVDSLVFPRETDTRMPSGFTKAGVIPVPGIRDVSAGSLLVSASDMGAFVEALFNGTIISKDTLRQMATVQNADNLIDRDFQIGLGFWLIDPMNTGELVAAHGGELPPAFYSVLITMPEKGIAVYTAINDQRGGMVHMETAMEIIDELILRDKGSKPNDVDRGAFLPVTEKDKSLYSGTFGTIAGLVQVVPKGDAFQATVTGSRLYLAPREYGRYGVQKRLFNIIPLPIKALESMEFDLFQADGDVWMGIWMGGVYMGAFSKLDEVEYPEAFEEYTGTYAIVDGGYTLEDGTEAIGDIAIGKKDGRFVLSLSLMGQPIEMALRPDGHGRALTDGTGRGMGDLLVFEKHGADLILHWSGMRMVCKR